MMAHCYGSLTPIKGIFFLLLRQYCSFVYIPLKSILKSIVCTRPGFGPYKGAICLDEVYLLGGPAVFWVPCSSSSDLRHPPQGGWVDCTHLHLSWNSAHTFLCQAGSTAAHFLKQIMGFFCRRRCPRSSQGNTPCHHRGEGFSVVHVLMQDLDQPGCLH